MDVERAAVLARRAYEDLGDQELEHLRMHPGPGEENGFHTVELGGMGLFLDPQWDDRWDDETREALKMLLEMCLPEYGPWPFVWEALDPTLRKAHRYVLQVLGRTLAPEVEQHYGLLEEAAATESAKEARALRRRFGAEVAGPLWYPVLGEVPSEGSAAVDTFLDVAETAWAGRRQWVGSFVPAEIVFLAADATGDQRQRALEALAWFGGEEGGDPLGSSPRFWLTIRRRRLSGAWRGARRTSVEVVTSRAPRAPMRRSGQS